MVVAACALLGLLLGSFATVVVVRVPEGRSVVARPSACADCGTALRPWQNVPVVSWLLLRGRCAACGRRIGTLYPLLETSSAALCALVGWRLGASAALLVALPLAWVLLVLAVVDARTRRIPNRITYPAFVVLVVLTLVAALLLGEPGRAVRALLAAFAAGGGLLALALANPRGMGMGDVKLATLIGLGLGFFGWAQVAVGLFAAFLLGGLLSLLLVAARSRGMKDLLPFGPHLALGAAAGLLVGEELWVLYLRVVGVA